MYPNRCYEILRIRFYCSMKKSLSFSRPRTEFWFDHDWVLVDHDYSWTAQNSVDFSPKIHKNTTSTRFEHRWSAPERTTAATALLHILYMADESANLMKCIVSVRFEPCYFFLTVWFFHVTEEPSNLTSSFQNCIVLGFGTQIHFDGGLAGFAALLPATSVNLSSSTQNSVLKSYSVKNCRFCLSASRINVTWHNVPHRRSYHTL